MGKCRNCNTTEVYYAPGGYYYCPKCTKDPEKRGKMIDLKHCTGCYDNFYNPNCWCRKTGKMVWRIKIGVDERPPYKHKQKRVPSCYKGGGGNRVIMIRKENLTCDGYWKW